MWRWDNEFDITLQYLILHLQTKCGYACSDQLRSTLAPSLVHADTYTFLAPHGVRQDSALRSSLVRFKTLVWGHSLTASMQRVPLKIWTRTFILRTSQFLNLPLQIYRSWSNFPSRIDISDEFSFTHMLEFSKLAVAFAVELGGYNPLKK